MTAETLDALLARRMFGVEGVAVAPPTMPETKEGGETKAFPAWRGASHDQRPETRGDVDRVAVGRPKAKVPGDCPGPFVSQGAYGLPLSLFSPAQPAVF